MSEYKLMPVEPTEEMLDEIHLVREFSREAIKARYKAMLAAAPAQEVEPVAVGIFKGDKMIGWNKVGEAKLLDETESAKDLYLSPPTAEQAAADMKRRCMDIVKNWRRVHALEECCDHAQYVALSEVEKLIESLPTSDTAMEEMRRDAERYRWLHSEHKVINPMASVVWKRNMDREESDWTNTASVEWLDEAIDAAIAAEKYQTEPKVTGSEN